MRKKKQANKLRALAHAARFFAFMHEHPQKPQVKRVNAILELLVGLRNELRNHKRLSVTTRQIRGLQKAFRRYRWCRELFFAADGPHVFTLSALHRNENLAGDIPLIDDEPNTDNDDDWEYGAVYILLHIAEYHPDTVPQIERCDVCHRWMFARKPDHRFCSGKCRQYEYDNDPVRKMTRLAHLRKRYAEQKERDRKLKERATRNR